MRLLLIRHAQAGERDPEQWPDDRLRPLTDRGRKAHARVCRGLRRRGVEPVAVFTSPWLRAAETAEIVVDELNPPQAAVETEALAAPPDLDDLRVAIGEHGPDDVVILVGHSPFLEELASLLLTGDMSRLAIDLPKSGTIAIDALRIEAGTGVLRFALRPKQAEVMGKK